MIKTIGVAHFSIPVTDVARSKAFYCEVLGMTEVADIAPMGMVFLDCGGMCFVLVKVDAPISTAGVRNVHHAFRIEPDQYESAVEELRSAGVKVLYEEDRRDGVIEGPRAYFHDPDQNTLEIIVLTDYARVLRERSTKTLAH